jgi:hypothetical protein
MERGEGINAVASLLGVIQKVQHKHGYYDLC